MSFELDGIQYSIDMYPHPDENYKEYFRAELHADGAQVASSDYAWKDVQEDIYPDPADYAKSAIRNFNKYLSEKHPNSEGTYADKVAAFFLNNVRLAGNQLEAF